MFGYRFEGYWKDVGTVESLWQSNMDILESDCLNLYDEDWTILSKSALASPHVLGKNSKVTDSFITEGCYIDGTVRHSVIFDGVTIESGAEVLDSVVMSGAIIGEGARVYKTIVGPGAHIGCNCSIGHTDEDEHKSKYCSGGVSLIGADVTIHDGATLGKNSMVTNDVEGGKR